MREIKFRAWDKEDGEMFFPETDNNSDTFWCGFAGKRGLRAVDPYEADYPLMQFTGLHDKNGKEIYEGDIIRILYTDWPSQPAEANGRYALSLEDYKKSISYVGFVQWEKDRWVINFGKGRFGDDETGRMDEGPHGEKEIIGNIYENPELLKN